MNTQGLSIGRVFADARAIAWRAPTRIALACLALTAIPGTLAGMLPVASSPALATPWILMAIC